MGNWSSCSGGLIILSFTVIQQFLQNPMGLMCIYEHLICTYNMCRFELKMLLISHGICLFVLQNDILCFKKFYISYIHSLGLSGTTPHGSLSHVYYTNTAVFYRPRFVVTGFSKRELHFHTTTTTLHSVLN